ncbi:MAG: VCBS repeat-containing protein, partial [Gammaproteobacteria bacterium]|nr:VCBS repeat-containing protein [Gammaproteobacteria bacterium]
MNKSAILLACGVAVLAACGGGGGGAPTPAPVPTPLPEPAPLPGVRQFVDATAASGIGFDIGYTRLQPNPDVERIATGGVAAGDYDNDGDVDLFVTRGDIGPNLLYRNNGLGVFTDVAAAAGIAFTATATENYRHTGPAFADMDGDGDLDLFLGGLFGDPSFIYQNSGAAGGYTFTNVTAGSGIDTLDRAYNISSSFGDYDLDGYVDLFVAHWGTGFDLADPGDTQHLWRNESSGGTIRFSSVSEVAGLSPSIVTLPDPYVLRQNADWTFAASIARIDGDLYPDIVVAADFNNSQVFLNRGDGTFDNATNVQVIIDYNGMGSALGDYDNDGDLDWFVSAIGEGNGQPVGDIGTLGNRLYRNTLGESAPEGIFVDATDAAGVADGGWGWGACFIDFENDGDLDIYHTNGWLGEYSDDTSRAFVSDGTGVFEDEAAEL